MSDAFNEVHAVVSRYAEGTRRRDAAMLREIFHPEARMFGVLGGREIAAPIASYIDHAAASDPGEAYQALIVRIDITGDAAVAVLEERGYQGSDFIDTFSLVKGDGGWRIVAKLFAVVGQESVA